MYTIDSNSRLQQWDRIDSFRIDCFHDWDSLNVECIWISDDERDEVNSSDVICFVVHDDRRDENSWKINPMTMMMIVMIPMTNKMSSMGETFSMVLDSVPSFILDLMSLLVLLNYEMETMWKLI